MNAEEVTVQEKTIMWRLMTGVLSPSVTVFGVTSKTGQRQLAELQSEAPARASEAFQVHWMVSSSENSTSSLQACAAGMQLPSPLLLSSLKWLREFLTSQRITQSCIWCLWYLWNVSLEIIRGYLKNFKTVTKQSKKEMFRNLHLNLHQNTAAEMISRLYNLTEN